MKKNKLSEAKIVELLKRIEKGADLESTIREYGISYPSGEMVCNAILSPLKFVIFN